MAKHGAEKYKSRDGHLLQLLLLTELVEPLKNLPANFEK